MTEWLKAQKSDRIFFPRRTDAGLVGIGIDVVSLSRAKLFLEKHRERAVRKILTAREARRFPGKKLTVEQFSRLFAAKEAYFKACGGTWLGLEGFASIHVEPVSDKHFRAASARIRPAEGGKAEGVFFSGPGLVGAEVVIWS